MKIKELRDFLNKLPNEKLNDELIVLSNDTTRSSIVWKIEQLRENYYYDDSDDPCELLSYSQYNQLSEDGKEDYELYLKRGNIALRF